MCVPSWLEMLHIQKQLFNVKRQMRENTNALIKPLCLYWAYTLPEKEERKTAGMKSSNPLPHDTHNKYKSFYLDAFPPVELWNNRNQPKPICTNNQGPLQVSAVLYNRNGMCHQKHNYSSFPTIKKGKIQKWQVIGLCSCRPQKIHLSAGYCRPS